MSTREEMKAALRDAFVPRPDKPAQCDDCGLVYEVDAKGSPQTADAYTCDDCGGYVEVPA